MRTLSVIAALCFLGCAGSEEEPTGTTPPATTPPGETPGTPAPTPTPNPEPDPNEEPDLSNVTFARVWAETPALATCNGCHGANAPNGGMSLATEELAFAALVTNAARGGSAAFGCGELNQRVVPGDPANSLFFQVISGNCGSNFSRMVLPANERPLIEAWIEQGAIRE